MWGDLRIELGIEEEVQKRKKGREKKILKEKKIEREHTRYT